MRICYAIEIVAELCQSVQFQAIDLLQRARLPAQAEDQAIVCQEICNFVGALLATGGGFPKYSAGSAERSLTVRAGWQAMQPGLDDVGWRPR